VSLLRVDPRNLAEELKKLENAALLAISILVYDVTHYRGSATVKDILDRCLIPKEICEENLAKLARMGVVEIRSGSIVLTNVGKKAIELARWGREL